LQRLGDDEKTTQAILKTTQGLLNLRSEKWSFFVPETRQKFVPKKNYLFFSQKENEQRTSQKIRTEFLSKKTPKKTKKS
jgi:hypothetical protein